MPNLTFLQLIAAQSEGETVDFLIANAFFNNLDINVKPLLQIELDKTVSHDYDTILKGEEPHAVERLEKAKQWAGRLDVKSHKGGLGHVFLNGKHFPLDTVRAFFVAERSSDRFV